MTAYRLLISACAGVAALTLGACGGGERQDADEPAGSYTVDVTEAEFPPRQRLAQQSQMRIAVKNTSGEVIPAIAVTVDSFSRRSEQPGLADPERPVWIVDQGPRGGDTAFVNTWSLDRLAPGETQTFRWRVTAVEAGSYRVRYTIAAGLDGRARARRQDGESPVTGTFRVRVSQAPSVSRVDPETGAVERVEPEPGALER